MRLKKQKINKTLNTKLFEGDKLKKEVRGKLLEITEAFLKELKENKIPIKVLDAWLVGSNVSYNYTSNSDLDLHLVANIAEASKDSNVLQLLYDFYRSHFNKKYDINIKGIQVEIYIEDVHSNTMSNGIYSINKDKWIKIPKRVDIPDVDISNELKQVVSEYENLKEEDTEEFLNNLYLKRKIALLDNEYAKDNLIFKEFRHLGYLDKLKDSLVAKKSKELSLEGLKMIKKLNNIKESRIHTMARFQEPDDEPEINWVYYVVDDSYFVLTDTFTSLEKAKKYAQEYSNEFDEEAHVYYAPEYDNEGEPFDTKRIKDYSWEWTSDLLGDDLDEDWLIEDSGYEELRTFIREAIKEELEWIGEDSVDFLQPSQNPDFLDTVYNFARENCSCSDYGMVKQVLIDELDKYRGSDPNEEDNIDWDFNPQEGGEDFGILTEAFTESGIEYTGKKVIKSKTINGEKHKLISAVVKDGDDIYKKGDTYYFITYGDYDDIDWGPCDTQKEAEEWFSGLKESLIKEMSVRGASGEYVEPEHQTLRYVKLTMGVDGWEKTATHPTNGNEKWENPKFKGYIVYRVKENMMEWWDLGEGLTDKVVEIHDMADYRSLFDRSPADTLKNHRKYFPNSGMIFYGPDGKRLKESKLKSYTTIALLRNDKGEEVTREIEVTASSREDAKDKATDEARFLDGEFIRIDYVGEGTSLSESTHTDKGSWMNDRIKESVNESNNKFYIKAIDKKTGNSAGYVKARYQSSPIVHSERTLFSTEDTDPDYLMKRMSSVYPEKDFKIIYEAINESTVRSLKAKASEWYSMIQSECGDDGNNEMFNILKNLGIKDFKTATDKQLKDFISNAEVIYDSFRCDEVEDSDEEYYEEDTLPEGQYYDIDDLGREIVVDEEGNVIRGPLEESVQKMTREQQNSLRELKHVLRGIAKDPKYGKAKGRWQRNSVVLEFNNGSFVLIRPDGELNVNESDMFPYGDEWEEEFLDLISEPFVDNTDYESAEKEIMDKVEEDWLMETDKEMGWGVILFKGKEPTKVRFWEEQSQAHDHYTESKDLVDEGLLKAVIMLDSEGEVYTSYGDIDLIQYWVDEKLESFVSKFGENVDVNNPAGCFEPNGGLSPGGGFTENLKESSKGEDVWVITNKGDYVEGNREYYEKLTRHVKQFTSKQEAIDFADIFTGGYDDYKVKVRKLSSKEVESIGGANYYIYNNYKENLKEASSSDEMSAALKLKRTFPKYADEITIDEVLKKLADNGYTNVTKKEIEDRQIWYYVNVPNPVARQTLEWFICTDKQGNIVGQDADRNGNEIWISYGKTTQGVTYKDYFIIGNQTRGSRYYLGDGEYGHQRGSPEYENSFIDKRGRSTSSEAAAQRFDSESDAKNYVKQNGLPVGWTSYFIKEKTKSRKDESLRGPNKLLEFDRDRWESEHKTKPGYTDDDWSSIKPGGTLKGNSDRWDDVKCGNCGTYGDWDEFGDCRSCKANREDEDDLDERLLLEDEDETEEEECEEPNKDNKKKPLLSKMILDESDSNSHTNVWKVEDIFEFGKKEVPYNNDPEDWAMKVLNKYESTVAMLRDNLRGSLRWRVVDILADLVQGNDPLRHKD